MAHGDSGWRINHQPTCPPPYPKHRANPPPLLSNHPSEFDVVSVVNAAAQQQYDDTVHGSRATNEDLTANLSDENIGGLLKLCVHNCVMHPDMKKMYQKATWFPSVG